MKIILLKDVSKLGRKGDVKDVADGYGRNMLMRMGLAELATPGAVKKIEEESKNVSKQKEKEHSVFHALRTALMERGVIIKKKNNEKGELYAAVSPKEILEALRTLKFPLPENIDDSMVIIETPIKTVGIHEAKIKLGAETTTVKIDVREAK
ncbi:MAG: 50S ribosomal protein L9 [bacterium]|nr:50S ribosomal protein L9 [bacterium]